MGRPLVLPEFCLAASLGVLVALAEALDAAGGVDDALLACEVGVRIVLSASAGSTPCGKRSGAFASSVRRPPGSSRARMRAV